MELVLLAIAVSGLAVAWKGVAGRSYFCGLMFSALLTGVALLGWWYSEILYTKNILYFFYAQSHIIPALGK